MPTYYYIQFNNICWLIIGIYWLINAWHAKPTIRRQHRLQRWAYILALVLSFILLYSPMHAFSFLRLQLIPHSDTSGISGCAICLAGILLAIWARYTLADNWSGNVTVKKDHQLVTSGPYSHVRHPIYTGALLAFLGSAFVFGQIKGFAAVLICFIGFWHKLRMEEDFMTAEFPIDYPAYRTRVKMLIPFII